MLFKLAERFAKKYAVDEQYVDHWGVDPETGTAIKPKFENGDIVSYKGREAVYISRMFWQEPVELSSGGWREPNQAMVQFLDVPALSKNRFGVPEGFNFRYVPEKDLKLVKKKEERSK